MAAVAAGARHTATSERTSRKKCIRYLAGHEPWLQRTQMPQVEQALNGKMSDRQYPRYCGHPAEPHSPRSPPLHFDTKMSHSRLADKPQQRFDWRTLTH